MKHFSLKLRKILLCDYLYYFVLVLSIIYIIVFIKKYIPPCNYDINDTNFILTITSMKVDGDKLSLEFKENLIGNYYFNTLEEKNNFLSKYELGDKINTTGTLKEPSENTIFNIFNYKKYLYYKGIKYILSIEEYDLNEKYSGMFIKIKNYFYKRVGNIKNNSYIYAFILGKSNYIDDESYNNYKINGVTHLFALSGLHVSIFSGILLSIFSKLKFNEKIGFILTSLFLIFFSFIASFTPSILRATIFFILSSINKIYYFYVKPKYLLYLTFIILVLINPLYIFNTGFILSFTITFFILLFNENYKINNSIMSILVISLLSFFSSLPIIINMSYEANIIGFINNVIFIPLVTNIIFPLAILTLIFNKLSFILNILTNIMEILSSISSNIINITIFFQKLTILEIVIYYVIFILIVKKKNKFIVPFILFIVYLYIKPSFDKNTYIYFIDVGQGDSTLIVTENNKITLIDTGGIVTYNYKEDWATKNKEFNLVTSSVLPFFKSIGVKKIDYLFLTHGDFDHMGEAINLVNNFKVEKVIFNCGQFNELEKELIKVLDKKKYDIIVVLKN